MDAIKAKFGIANFALNELAALAFKKKIGDRIFQNPKQIQAVVAGIFVSAFIRSIEPYIKHQALEYMSEKKWSWIMHGTSFVIPFLFAIYMQGPLMASLLTSAGIGATQEALRLISKDFSKGGEKILYNKSLIGNPLIKFPQKIWNAITAGNIYII